ncbi:hypothetical protein ACI2L1_45185, partial [Streptomyces sp. NPDC019531]|uniref:hypothetical protein n=1 Tax=Streptomyces sp. NPDC019531 TaxID=3365062 RepID=UPI003850BDB0
HHPDGSDTRPQSTSTADSDPTNFSLAPAQPPIEATVDSALEDVNRFGQSRAETSLTAKSSESFGSAGPDVFDLIETKTGSDNALALLSFPSGEKRKFKEQFKTFDLGENGVLHPYEQSADGKYWVYGTRTFPLPKGLAGKPVLVIGGHGEPDYATFGLKGRSSRSNDSSEATNQVTLTPAHLVDTVMQTETYAKALKMAEGMGEKLNVLFWSCMVGNEDLTDVSFAEEAAARLPAEQVNVWASPYTLISSSTGRFGAVVPRAGVSDVLKQFFPAAVDDSVLNGRESVTIGNHSQFAGAVSLRKAGEDLRLRHDLALLMSETDTEKLVARLGGKPYAVLGRRVGNKVERYDKTGNEETRELLDPKRLANWLRENGVPEKAPLFLAVDRSGLKELIKSGPDENSEEWRNSFAYKLAEFWEGPVVGVGGRLRQVQNLRTGEWNLTVDFVPGVGADGPLTISFPRKAFGQTGPTPRTSAGATPVGQDPVTSRRPTASASEP